MLREGPGLARWAADLLHRIARRAADAQNSQRVYTREFPKLAVGPPDGRERPRPPARGRQIALPVLLLPLGQLSASRTLGGQKTARRTVVDVSLLPAISRSRTPGSCYGTSATW